MAAPARHVVITGGTGGIGFAIARLFTQNSWRCTIIGRSGDRCRDAIARLPKSDTEHNYIVGDISLPQFWASQFERNKQPDVDVLVNAAGMTENMSFKRYKALEVERVIAVNLTAMMHATRQLLRAGYLKKKKDDVESFTPCIINVSSLLGVKGGRGAVPYATSKAGVLGFTRALVAEAGSTGLRANVIVPGYIDTDMTKELKAEQILPHIPAGRFGTPEEVAEAAMFLVKNQYANNCVLNLDGGLSAT